VFDPHRVKARSLQTAVEESDGAGTVETSEPASAKGGQLDFSTGTTADEEGGADCGVTLAGEEPPVETYDVGVEEGVVVVYL
jgi:hypothetical protein